jgi:hypothetical protein
MFQRRFRVEVLIRLQPAAKACSQLETFTQANGTNTANFFLDEASGQELYMESADLVLRPTLFEKAGARGIVSALLSSKKKTISLLPRGARVVLSAETPTPEWIERLLQFDTIHAPVQTPTGPVSTYARASNGSATPRGRSPTRTTASRWTSASDRPPAGTRAGWSRGTPTRGPPNRRSGR